jgi:hypothetical protein
MYSAMGPGKRRFFLEWEMRLSVLECWDKKYFQNLSPGFFQGDVSGVLPEVECGGPLIRCRLAVNVGVSPVCG